MRPNRRDFLLRTGALGASALLCTTTHGAEGRADICAQDVERAARYLVAKRYASRYEMGLDVLKSLPYSRWRESDPEDTIRFHALRLHEVGMIKSVPDKLIARGTDWRFLNELKKELKA